jgi:Acetate kinase
MADSILTVNAGSSSIKFALFEHAGDAHRVMGQIDGIGVRTHMKIKGQAGETLFDEDLEGADDHHASLAAILRWFEANIPDMAIAAVGHRVVHGGVKYAEPVKVTAEVADDLEACVPWRPCISPTILRAFVRPWQTSPTHSSGLFRHGIPSAASLRDDTFALPHHFMRACALCFMLPMIISR